MHAYIDINSMDHYKDPGIQVFSYEVLGGTNGHALRGHSFI